MLLIVGGGMSWVGYLREKGSFVFLYGVEIKGYMVGLDELVFVVGFVNGFVIWEFGFYILKYYE